MHFLSGHLAMASLVRSRLIPRPRDPFLFMSSLNQCINKVAMASMCSSKGFPHTHTYVSRAERATETGMACLPHPKS